MLSFKNILGTLILSLASVFFYTHVLEHDWRYKVPTDEQVKKYIISETKAIALYQLMKDAHELLGKNNINYLIEGGTLLGAVRHQGIIPFDDDLDIGIMHEDEIFLQQILPQLSNLVILFLLRDLTIYAKKFAWIFLFFTRSKINLFIPT